MKWIRAMMIMAILLSASGCNEEISMAKIKKLAMADKWFAEKAWQW